jgi:hypothetical protein
MTVMSESSLSMASPLRLACIQDHSKCIPTSQVIHSYYSTNTPSFPHPSTCFNRIDLPIYEEKEELEEKLKIAITMAATGFDME